MKALERAKMQFALPICYLTAREMQELIWSTQRGLREVPERNQTSGCQVHRPKNDAGSLFTGGTQLRRREQISCLCFLDRPGLPRLGQHVRFNCSFT